MRNTGNGSRRGACLVRRCRVANPASNTANWPLPLRHWRNGLSPCAGCFVVYHQFFCGTSVLPKKEVVRVRSLFIAEPVDAHEVWIGNTDDINRFQIGKRFWIVPLFRLLVFNGGNQGLALPDCLRPANIGDRLHEEYSGDHGDHRDAQQVKRRRVKL